MGETAMSENEKNKTMTSELGEEELNKVAGGRGDIVECQFVHKGSERRKRASGELYTGEWEMECSSFLCNSRKCSCHGTERCKDKWHVVTENGSPLPVSEHEHWYA